MRLHALLGWMAEVLRGWCCAAVEHSTSANVSTRGKGSAAEERCRDIPFFTRPTRAQMIPTGEAGVGCPRE